MLTDAGVTGILIAHLGAFGSGELKIDNLCRNWRPNACLCITMITHMLNYHLSCIWVTWGQAIRKWYQSHIFSEPGSGFLCLPSYTFIDCVNLENTLS